MLKEHTQRISLVLKDTTIAILDELIKDGLIIEREEAIECCLRMYLPKFKNVRLFQREYALKYPTEYITENKEI